MPAVNFDLMYQAMVATTRRRLQPDRLLVAAARLEEPDADAEPRRDLPDAVLRHRRTRAGGAGDPAGRRRVDHGQRRRMPGRRRSRTSGPAGVDKGKGGKYLILPPGYNGEVARRLHRAAVRTPTAGYALLRSNLKSGSDADVAAAVAYGKRVKLYPLAQAANPPATTFVDAVDVCSTRRSPTTCASSSRSTASCRPSPG